MSNAELSFAGWTSFRNHIDQTRIAKRMEALRNTGTLVAVYGIVVETKGTAILSVRRFVFVFAD